jgi:anti-anti-sigma factor
MIQAHTSSPVTVGKLTIHLEGSAGEVIRCVGRLTSDNHSKLKDLVRPRIFPGSRVILDFSELVYLDSAGLGSIVSLYVSSKTHRCELQFIKLNPRIKELFGVTNLLGAFQSAAEHGTKF